LLGVLALVLLVIAGHNIETAGKSTDN